MSLPRGITPRAVSSPAGLDGVDWRRFERLAFVSWQPTAAGLGGEHLSKLRAPSIEFVEHHAYQPGDDLRRVDWNVYGRLGSLQVKVTEATERLDLLLLLDCSASMRWGEPDKLDYARRVAAGLAYVGLQRSDTLRLACLGEETSALGPLSGRARLPEVIRFLERVAPGGQLALDESLPAVLSTLPAATRSRRALIVLLSDLLVEEHAALGEAFDALLSRGHDVAVIQVLSPQEEAPEALGDVELIDAETGERIEVGLSQEVVDIYRARLGAWLSNAEAVCRRRGLRYVRTRTDHPVDALLLHDLRRIKLLR